MVIYLLCDVIMVISNSCGIYLWRNHSAYISEAQFATVTDVFRCFLQFLTWDSILTQATTYSTQNSILRD
jgi:hypothetical protein